jgi:hypothetical protein
MIGTLPKALHYTISFMGHDTRILFVYHINTGINFRPRVRSQILRHPAWEIF